MAIQDVLDSLEKIANEGNDTEQKKAQAAELAAQQETARLAAEDEAKKANQPEIKIGYNLRPIDNNFGTELSHEKAVSTTAPAEAELKIMPKEEAEKAAVSKAEVEEPEESLEEDFSNGVLPDLNRDNEEPAQEAIQEEEVVEEKTETVTSNEEHSKSNSDFNAAEALQDATVNGNLALLRQGSRNRDAIEHAQKILVETGFLQTEDQSAENYIDPVHFGYMNGTVTTDALNRLQQSMKDSGANIRVDSPNRVRGYTETWTALAVCQHLGIRNGEVTSEAANLYNKSKNDGDLKAIAGFNAEIIEGIERIKESPLGAQSPDELRFAQQKTLVLQVG